MPPLFDFYFRPRPGEARLYERLGVRRFKKYLPTGGDLHARHIKWHPILRGEGGFVESMRRFDGRTRLAETCHVVTLLFFALVIVGFISGENYLAALLVGLANVLINVYPIMVQRYNRSRLYRLLERRAS